MPIENRFILLALSALVSATPCLAASSVDSAPLKLHWSCQFDSDSEEETQLSCSDFEQYFFDANSKEVTAVTDPKVADIQVSLTQQHRPGNLHRYYISFVASERFETPPITLPWIDIDDGIALENRRTALQNRILSGVRLYQTTLSSGTTPDSEKGKPFYFEAGLNGSGNSSGDVKNMNITNSYSASYFPKNERFRFDIHASGGWYSQTIPGEDGAIKGNLFVPEVSVTGVYSLDKSMRWSVAVITEVGSAAGANMKSYERFQTGIEYILVPFLTNQTNQVAIRAGASWNQLSLVNPNSLDHLDEKLMAAFAQIVYVNQFAKGKLNLNANVKATTRPTYKGFNTYSGGATVSYRIGSAVSLNVSGRYQQMKNSLTYPAELDYSNPAQLMFLGDAPGRNFNYSFGIKLMLGRTSKRTNDRRWGK